jgi:hypothetical protein
MDATTVLIVIWNLQPVPCVLLGYLTARRTGRSTFNWIVVGLLASIPPIVGIFLMLAAYYWYPAPAPRAGPGYQPRLPGAGGRDRRHRR